MGDSETATTRVQNFTNWTLHDVFDFNPGYVKQIRGLLNIAHVVLTMLTLAIVGGSCQMQPYVDEKSMGFYCRSPDTFLFVMAVSSFLGSLMLFICCILSKKTEKRIFTTSYEITFYVFYSSFFFIAAIALLASVVGRNKGKEEFEKGYATTVTGGIFGIFCCIAYGGSAVWFYLYHKKYDAEEAEPEEEEAAM